MLDRLIDNLRAIIRSEFPDYAFKGVYEYVIQSVNGTLVSADPTDTTLSLPSIPSMPMQSGLLGETVKPTVGKLCYVVFVNGKRSRPMIVGCQGEDDEIEIPATTSIKLASGVLGAARLNDTILAGGMFAGTITSASTKVKVG